MPCKELIARGRVQGVGFRWFVMQCAIRHQIKGYVHNRGDGSVFIMASGETSDLARFVEQVKNGTNHAVVASLEDRTCDYNGDFGDFSIR